jgi:hypothetical protein
MAGRQAVGLAGQRAAVSDLARCGGRAHPRPANSLTVFQGLPEERYELEFVQHVFGGSGVSGTTSARNGIGWNSTTAASGFMGYGFGDQGSGHNNPFGDNLVARYLQVPSLGINVVTALETAPETTNTVSWFGGEDDMVLLAMWRG